MVLSTIQNNIGPTQTAHLFVVLHKVFLTVLCVHLVILYLYASNCTRVRRSYNRGLTLIEFLLYFALATIMTVLLSTIGAVVLESRVKAHALEDIQYNTQFIFEKIKQNIQSAEAINDPTFGTSADVLSLTMSDPSKNPTVFSVIEGKVWMIEGLNPTVQLSSNVVSIDTLTVLNTAPNDDVLGIVRIEMSIGAYGTPNQSFSMSGRIKK